LTSRVQLPLLLGLLISALLVAGKARASDSADPMPLAYDRYCVSVDTPLPIRAPELCLPSPV